MRCRWCESQNVIEEHGGCLKCCEMKGLLTYLGEPIYIPMPMGRSILEAMWPTFLREVIARSLGIPKELLEAKPR